MTVETPKIWEKEAYEKLFDRDATDSSLLGLCILVLHPERMRGSLCWVGDVFLDMRQTEALLQ